MSGKRTWSGVAIAVGLMILAWLLLPTFRLAPPSPALRGLGNQGHWILAEDMAWRIGDTDLSITVPRGFVTDLASTPQFVWSLGLAPQGQYGRAAIVHDYLYWFQDCSREQSDRLMLKAMQESSVDAAVIARIHAAVAGFGATAWTANATERAGGAFRVLPVELARPEDPNQSWPQYRRSLAGKGIKDPPSTIDPRVCQLADHIVVPNTPPADPTNRMPGG